MVEPERNNGMCVGMPANDPMVLDVVGRHADALAIVALGLHHVKACACVAVW